MTWYSACLLKSVRLRNGKQEDYPVYETVFLIEAESFDEATSKGEAIGRLEEQAGQDLTYCDLPAYYQFIGIRKLKKTFSAGEEDVGSMRPRDGSEISSSYYEVNSIDLLDELARGGRVAISYVDDSD